MSSGGTPLELSAKCVIDLFDGRRDLQTSFRWLFQIFDTIPPGSFYTIIAPARNGKYEYALEWNANFRAIAIMAVALNINVYHKAEL